MFVVLSLEGNLIRHRKNLCFQRNTIAQMQLSLIFTLTQGCVMFLKNFFNYPIFYTKLGFSFISLCVCFLTNYLFIYFWPSWVFVAAHRLSLVAPSRSSSQMQSTDSRASSSSCCPWAQQSWPTRLDAPRHVETSHATREVVVFPSFQG